MTCSYSCRGGNAHSTKTILCHRRRWQEACSCQICRLKTCRTLSRGQGTLAWSCASKPLKAAGVSTLVFQPRVPHDWQQKCYPRSEQKSLACTCVSSSSKVSGPAAAPLVDASRGLPPPDRAAPPSSSPSNSCEHGIHHIEKKCTIIWRQHKQHVRHPGESRCSGEPHQAEVFPGDHRSQARGHLHSGRVPGGVIHVGSRSQKKAHRQEAVQVGEARRRQHRLHVVIRLCSHTHIHRTVLHIQTQSQDRQAPNAPPLRVTPSVSAALHIHAAPPVPVCASQMHVCGARRLALYPHVPNPHNASSLADLP